MHIHLNTILIILLALGMATSIVGIVASHLVLRRLSVADTSFARGITSVIKGLILVKTLSLLLPVVMIGSIADFSVVSDWRNKTIVSVFYFLFSVFSVITLKVSITRIYKSIKERDRKEEVEQPARR